MAHVWASRALLPDMLDRGSGYLVNTASAAGLTTQVSALAYSATKHAAVALAEWMAIAYGDRGISVSCMCPQGVQTAMLEQTGPARAIIAADGALTPDQVADAMWEGLQDDRFLILPHPEAGQYYRDRAGDTDRWLGGMNKLQRWMENQEGAR
jgi:short-subunit dehydrogenase